ncbi:hypothetical protein GCK72_000165 [Caenorhabditis remanei]|uniref:Uncharacterized protein n=1 Tax=Caenorhabditis remanei TaxID=31234 RepID=A0A6A5HQ16_CAERE|nr:hypothetical protein GCK72_000165 [Caenorhabditis remanei]KAF1768353.1 hypothetical protein GCK72_000165 [Caenorhabditis remanei]
MFAGDIIALTGKLVNDPKVANPVICNQGNRKLMENENINKADKDVLNHLAQCLHFSSGSNNIVIKFQLLHCEVQETQRRNACLYRKVQKSAFGMQIL